MECDRNRSCGICGQWHKNLIAVKLKPPFFDEEREQLFCEDCLNFAIAVCTLTSSYMQQYSKLEKAIIDLRKHFQQLLTR